MLAVSCEAGYALHYYSVFKRVFPLPRSKNRAEFYRLQLYTVLSC